MFPSPLNHRAGQFQRGDGGAGRDTHADEAAERRRLHMRISRNAIIRPRLRSACRLERPNRELKGRASGSGG